MNAKHTQWEVITRSGWAGAIETPRTSATLIINTDDFDTLEDVRQAVESMPALRAENERLREALQAIERQAGHVAEALRIDGRMVGAYTKADASVHCGQIEAEARAALAGGE